MDCRSRPEQAYGAGAGDEFCMKNDGFCMKNDEFCMKNDEFRI